MIGRLVARGCNQLLRSNISVFTHETSNSVCALKIPIPVVQTPVPLAGFMRGLHGSTLKVQHPAPPFKGTAVIAGDFKEIDLSDFRGQYLVLFFYPLDFTFVCPTEIIAFSDRMNEFKAINTAVVGVSCDSHFSHLAWINTPRKHGGLGNLNYPLLSDFNKCIARDYNVLLEEDGVPLRGLFIIDPQGVVRQITVNDLPVGRSVDEVLRLVKAFQFTDKHGEVCPANWKPESPTIKPSPDGSKEYFEKVNK
ncbi:peroxiredoxin-1-like isoform X2 [Macrosteles quadrilineatus]|uniref:peroxiredoxin-1-like isoform X2 n=1 Tax=Macrosteles quadrilineatus TaxID=74068 RepID=UPI0023E0F3C5|nr:peroxiredoxin-1-like isoform X2 [Macrosteles quadrilineatus]XP_054290102.1 peroxiredoxin-1-like isoform X2 [Macrosteles quadrilineatus]